MIVAQHGYGKSDKLQRGLTDGAIGGVILSPRDESPANMENLVESLTSEYPDALVLFDPQFYATIISPANDGHLPEYRAYYQPGLSRGSFISAAKIAGHVRRTLDYQVGLGLSRLVSPSVCVEAFDDPWSQIALSMAQAAVEYHASLDNVPELLVTLAFSETALDSRESVEEILDLLSVLEAHGFYLLVKRIASNYSPNFDSARLQNLLYLVYALGEINNFEVVCGYTDIYGVLLHAVGAAATGTGWFNSLRQFSLARFQPKKPGGRRPRPRYTSPQLLNSILVSEVATVAYVNELNRIVAGTKEDGVLMRGKPAGPEDWPLDLATMHHWRVLSSLVEAIGKGTVAQRLGNSIKAIQLAQSTYSLLRRRGADFEAPSSEAHLPDWLDAVQGFRAQI